MDNSTRARRRKLDTAKRDLEPPVKALRLAAQEMGGGPPGSGCRTGVQTTGSCCGTMAVVVSVSEKSRLDCGR